MASDAMASVGAWVVVAVYEHQYGTQVRVFQKEDQAVQWRREIAADWWEGEFGEGAPTSGDIGATYFEDTEGESFSIHRVQVEGS